jgi:hypothetical protein
MPGVWYRHPLSLGQWNASSGYGSTRPCISNPPCDSCSTSRASSITPYCKRRDAYRLRAKGIGSRDQYAELTALRGEDARVAAVYRESEDARAPLKRSRACAGSENRLRRNALFAAALSAILPSGSSLSGS